MINLLSRIFILFFFICGPILFAQETKVDELRRAFDQNLFQRHLNFLGSDLFEGRAPGLLGGNLAAKYLALEFDKLKLRPLGANGSYYQNIPMKSSKPLRSTQLKLLYQEEKISFRLNEDYLLYQSNEPTFIPIPVELVFVGYGIVAPEFDYNDYQDIDVSGKIVVFIEGEPLSLDSSYFDGENPTVYSTPEAKQRIALSRGAMGTILIPNINLNKNYNWQNQINQFSFPNLSLAFNTSSSLNILMNPEVSDILFFESGYTLEDIYRMHSEYKLRCFPLRIKLSFKGSVDQHEFMTPNIVGMLAGRDPNYSDKYIIVSAHYDHLGIGPAVKGDSIYNGVFDNAAGVSALLEIARVFVANQIQHKRSIIFLLTTAEESGLLGSYYYTVNPVVPLYKTVANINIDGIASFDRFKSVIAVGKEYSTLADIVNEITSERTLDLSDIPKEFFGFGAFTKSDQHSFAKSGVPSLMILEGTDYVNLSRSEGLKRNIEYAKNIYHSPFDDLNQKINYEAVSQHLEIILSLIEKIANTEKEPEWYSGSPYINARLISRAEKR
jgi:hypothetical protein